MKCIKCGSENIYEADNRFMCGDCYFKFTNPDRLNLFFSYGHDKNAVLVRKIQEYMEKRGHCVWIDYSRISTGSEWRETIEKGILESDSVVAFLSKHSLRENGVCLDELNIALGVSNVNVQTILMENQEKINIPSSLCKKQWLDLSNWEEKQAEGEEQFEKWFEENMEVLCRILESDENRQFQGDIEILREYLKPFLNDEREINLRKKAFIGRKKIVSKLEEWRADENEKRILVIHGKPGSGKSALLANLAHYNPNVLFGIFCEQNKNQMRLTEPLIRNMAFRLATKLPVYRKKLLEILFSDKKKVQKSGEECLKELVIKPLNSITDIPSEKQIILIDAIDETADGNNSFSNILMRNIRLFPDWIRFAITTRTPEQMRAYRHQTKEICLDDYQEEDISEFIKYHLGSSYTDKISSLIMQKSEGSFLYVSLLMSQLKNGNVTLEDIPDMPKGIYGFYKKNFNDIFRNADIVGDSADLLKLISCISYKNIIPTVSVRKMLGFSEEKMRSLLKYIDVWVEKTYYSIECGIYEYAPSADALQFIHSTVSEWFCNKEASGKYTAMDISSDLAEYVSSVFDEESYDDIMEKYFIWSIAGEIFVKTETYEAFYRFLNKTWPSELTESSWRYADHLPMSFDTKGIFQKIEEVYITCEEYSPCENIFNFHCLTDRMVRICIKAVLKLETEINSSDYIARLKSFYCVYSCIEKIREHKGDLLKKQLDYFAVLAIISAMADNGFIEETLNDNLFDYLFTADNDEADDFQHNDINIIEKTADKLIFENGIEYNDSEYLDVVYCGTTIREYIELINTYALFRYFLCSYDIDEKKVSYFKSIGANVEMALLKSIKYCREKCTEQLARLDSFKNNVIGIISTLSISLGKWYGKKGDIKFKLGPSFYELSSEDSEQFILYTEIQINNLSDKIIDINNHMIFEMTGISGETVFALPVCNEKRNICDTIYLQPNSKGKYYIAFRVGKDPDKENVHIRIFMNNRYYEADTGTISMFVKSYEDIYVESVKAENELNYSYAMDLFQKINSYKDSSVHYASIREKVKKYNGVYPVYTGYYDSAAILMINNGKAVLFADCPLTFDLFGDKSDKNTICFGNTGAIEIEGEYGYLWHTPFETREKKTDWIQMVLNLQTDKEFWKWDPEKDRSYLNDRTLSFSTSYKDDTIYKIELPSEECYADFLRNIRITEPVKKINDISEITDEWFDVCYRDVRSIEAFLYNQGLPYKEDIEFNITEAYRTDIIDEEFGCSGPAKDNESFLVIRMNYISPDYEVEIDVPNGLYVWENWNCRVSCSGRKYVGSCLKYVNGNCNTYFAIFSLPNEYVGKAVEFEMLTRDEIYYSGTISCGDNNKSVTKKDIYAKANRYHKQGYITAARNLYSYLGDYMNSQQKLKTLDKALERFNGDFYAYSMDNDVVHILVKNGLAEISEFTSGKKYYCEIFRKKVDGHLEYFLGGISIQKLMVDKLISSAEFTNHISPYETLQYDFNDSKAQSYQMMERIIRDESEYVHMIMHDYMDPDYHHSQQIIRYNDKNGEFIFIEEPQENGYGLLLSDVYEITMNEEQRSSIEKSFADNSLYSVLYNTI